MRLALFTLDSLVSRSAVRRFIELCPHDIVFVGRSDPYRRIAGGFLGQLSRHWRRSGWRFLPYLAANFTFPELLTLLERAAGQAGGSASAAARRRGIPCHTISDVNGPACAALLTEAGVELIVSFHFDQIFNAATLALVPAGGINVHPALLPHHRGPVPTFYAQLETPRRFGVSVHRLIPKIDAGPILAQRAAELPEGISAIGAAAVLHDLGTDLLLSVLGVPTDTLNRAPPDETLPYCGFPDAQELRRARQRGVHLVRLADLRAAWQRSFSGHIAPPGR